MSFGDGSDGDVVISVNTTLTCDMNYNNLTINAGVTLYPDGYVIYVSDTLTVNGEINRDGNNGLGVTPGAALPTNTVGGSGRGGSGGAYREDGEDGESVSGIANSSGGDGATRHGPYPSFRWDGGLGGETNPLYTVVDTNTDDIITNAATRLGGPGGGGGSALLDHLGDDAGGGGGSGAGVVYISARNVVINSTGVLSLKGGAGGFVPGGPGGGGGGGGCFVLVYTTITNTGTIDVSGGAGINYSYDGTDGTIYLFEAAAATINPGRSHHHSTGASVPGGIGCGMGKRRR